MKRLVSPRAGFTLIELLTVIAIITILAGLTIGGMNFAWRQAGLKKAEGEIHAFSTALESYKSDNGDYPRDSSTDNIDPRVDGNPMGSGGTGFDDKYQKASLSLYAALSGVDYQTGAANAPRLSGTNGAKRYFEFKQNQLSPKNPVNQSAPVTALLDPFGYPYGYSTKQSSAIQAANTSNSGNQAAANNVGYNPTFDLWSTAGSSSAGAQIKWVKNW